MLSLLVDSLVDTMVKPLIGNLRDLALIESKVVINKITNGFKKHLSSRYEYLSELNTIVNHVQGRSIKDIYIPLTIVTREFIDFNGIANDVKIDFRSNNKMVSSLPPPPPRISSPPPPPPLFTNVKYKLIDSFIDVLKKIDNRLIIVDNAGMGKSTILKMAYLESIDKNLALPILIELRNLSDTYTILDEIQSQVTELFEKGDREVIIKCLNSNKCIFLFDGYDEVSHISKMDVTRQLIDFSNRFDKVTIILTSRNEDSLSSFTNFKQVSIQPLKEEEAYLLIKKYDFKNKVADELISVLNKGYSNEIKSYLKNPLLTSLLYTVFDHRSIIPLKKHLFYRQVYDCLFERHDLTKQGGFNRDKSTSLGIDDLHSVLRCIGYLTYKSGTTSFSLDELTKFVIQTNNFLPLIEFKGSDLILDITYSVPLMIREGLKYKWIHKSMQEYFAAQFIFLDTKDKKEEVFSRLLENPHENTNVIDIYSDIDRYTFDKFISIPILKHCIAALDGIKYDSVYTREIYNSIFGVEFIYMYEDIFSDKNITHSFDKHIIGQNGMDSASFYYLSNQIVLRHYDVFVNKYINLYDLVNFEFSDEAKELFNRLTDENTESPTVIKAPVELDESHLKAWRDIIATVTGELFFDNYIDSNLGVNMVYLLNIDRAKALLNNMEKSQSVIDDFDFF